MLQVFSTVTGLKSCSVFIDVAHAGSTCQDTWGYFFPRKSLQSFGDAPETPVVPFLSACFFFKDKQQLLPAITLRFRTLF
jgi:hypothetical protein